MGKSEWGITHEILFIILMMLQEDTYLVLLFGGIALFLFIEALILNDWCD